MKLYIIYFLLGVVLCSTRDITVERRESIDTGDIIRSGADKKSCFAWNGVWYSADKSCYCRSGQTFYSDLNQNLGCYNGTGKRIGCSVSIQGYSNIVTFYQKDADNPYYSLGVMSPNCKVFKQFQRWDAGGWRLAPYWFAKKNAKSVTISWLNVVDYDVNVKGHLFKLSLSDCEGPQTDACLLFKNIGTQLYTIASPATDAPSTKPASTVIIPPEKSGNTSGNDLAIALGVLCAILIIVVVGLCSLWLWKRKKSNEVDHERSFLQWIYSKGRRQKQDDHDNIYEDIGAKQLEAIKKRPQTGPCPRRPLEIDSLSTSQYNRAYVKDESSPAVLLRNNHDDVYEAPVEENSSFDVYEMPVEEKQPENTSTDIYEMAEDNQDNNITQEDFYEMPSEDDEFNESSINTQEEDFYDMPEEEAPAQNNLGYDMPDERENNFRYDMTNERQNNLGYDMPDERDQPVSFSQNDDIYDEPADETKPRVWSVRQQPSTTTTPEEMYDLPEEKLTTDDFYDTPEEQLPPLPLPTDNDIYRPPEVKRGSDAYKALTNPIPNDSQRYSALSSVSSQDSTNTQTLNSNNPNNEVNTGYVTLNKGKTSDEEGYSTLTNRSENTNLRTNSDSVYSEPTDDLNDVYSEPDGDSNDVYSNPDKDSNDVYSDTDADSNDVYSEPIENRKPTSEPFYFQTYSQNR